MNDFVKNLKPGDDVIIESWSWVGSDYFETKVIRVTPKGFVNVDGLLFKPDGYCRGGGQQLLDPKDLEVQERVKEYKRKKFVNSILRKMCGCRKLSYEQAVKISEILQEDSK